MVPIQGKSSLSLYSSKKVVGISKLARTVDIFAKRLTNTGNNDSTNCRLY